MKFNNKLLCVLYAAEGASLSNCDSARRTTVFLGDQVPSGR
jgi:hypothetical protein